MHRSSHGRYGSSWPQLRPTAISTGIGTRGRATSCASAPFMHSRMRPAARCICSVAISNSSSSWICVHQQYCDALAVRQTR